MWSYILRRLLIMIPTLFGVTVVAFCVMQLAPGDPAKGRVGAQGTANPSVREAYLIQKRELKLDKPILLNIRWFRDYSEPMRQAAYFFSLTPEQIAEELNQLAKAAQTPDSDNAPQQAKLQFLRSLNIFEFNERLSNSEQRVRLAASLPMQVQIFCENTGEQGVPPLMAMLESSDTPLQLKIGALRCLPHMVLDPFTYTYTRRRDPAETPLIVATWKTWWERNKDKFQPVSTERRSELHKQLVALATETKSSVLVEQMATFQPADMPFFAETLLGDSTLQEKVVASLALRSYLGKPLKVDVPLDATATDVREVSQNWLAMYDVRRQEFQPGFLTKCWDLFTDTQYAHMAGRLVTFNFGRSAIKTRDPVGPRIWEAAKVSAPLMLMAQLVIYLVAVPLGILCAVNHGLWLDRFVTLGLFFLYSIPGFVAGMLFLLFLCYGDYLKLFPMLGMHSEMADDMSFGPWLLDYLWHAFLPVVCLSLFSLAGMAMYARSSMLEVIAQDFIRTARAKGVPARKVIWKHALRNALIPIVTLFANFLPAMLGGSVLIEVLFGIPGMGRLSWASIDQKDFPMLMALIYIEAIVVMLSILLSDILYVVVDPRIRLGGSGDAA